MGKSKSWSRTEVQILKHLALKHAGDRERVFEEAAKTIKRPKDGIVAKYYQIRGYKRPNRRKEKASQKQEKQKGLLFSFKIEHVELDFENKQVIVRVNNERSF